MRLPADHYSDAAREPALTCVAPERSRKSPVQRQPERRSPTAMVTGGTDGGEGTIPSRQSDKRHPCPPQAPVLATAEKGLAQARAERRAEPSLPALDVVLEEEVPVGNPTQDGGGESREIDDITSGGHCGTGWKMAASRDQVAVPDRLDPGRASRPCGSLEAARRENRKASPMAPGKCCLEEDLTNLGPRRAVGIHQGENVAMFKNGIQFSLMLAVNLVRIQDCQHQSWRFALTSW
ncbi:uncharacterized protein LOC142476704 [Ascaphus truei]|uniref:uncharacterized protein LOC142476704 n=1 Tax=Ascaphus truei TaxID=8439 RepID=UPI003F5ABC51